MSNRVDIRLIIAIVASMSGCALDSLGEVSQPVVSFPGTPLQNVFMKASHNTYISGNTWNGMWVSDHFQGFQESTNHIELDLVDNSAFNGTYPDTWTIAHGSSGNPTTKCDVGSTLEWCLSVIRLYQSYVPNHELITVMLDKKEDWLGARTPAALDAWIASYFPDSMLVTPYELRGSYPTLRQRIETEGWPTHDSMRGKFMFLMSSEGDPAGNSRLNTYASYHAYPKVFVAPYASALSQLDSPVNFSAYAIGWTVVFGFKWQSYSWNKDCQYASCMYMKNAHDRKFLTRAYDIDDSLEADMASSVARGGTKGAANFIALDHPWEQGGLDGFGNFPNGTYP